jgi:hypothetical protein
MPQFLTSKIPQEFERAARANPVDAKNALLVAMGTTPASDVTPAPDSRVQHLAQYLVKLRDGYLVAHDENYFYADMYIRTFLK